MVSQALCGCYPLPSACNSPFPCLLVPQANLLFAEQASVVPLWEDLAPHSFLHFSPLLKCLLLKEVILGYRI